MKNNIEINFTIAIKELITLLVYTNHIVIEKINENSGITPGEKKLDFKFDDKVDIQIEHLLKYEEKIVSFIELLKSMNVNQHSHSWFYDNKTFSTLRKIKENATQSNWDNIKTEFIPYTNLDLSFDTFLFDSIESIYIDGERLDILCNKIGFDKSSTKDDVIVNKSQFNEILNLLSDYKEIDIVNSEQDITFTVNRNNYSLRFLYIFNDDSIISSYLTIILKCNDNFGKVAELSDKIISSVSDISDIHFEERNIDEHGNDILINFALDELTENVKTLVDNLFLNIDELSRTIDNEKIKRVVKFSQEQCQAGIGVLSYFGKVLNDKYPNITNSISIHQDGNIVRLEIECEDGTKEIIEKTLNDYSLVLSQQESPEILFNDKLKIKELEMKLRHAAIEVMNTKEFLELHKEQNNTNKQEHLRETLSLKEEIQFLRDTLSQQLLTTNQLALGCVNQFDKLITLADGKQDVIQAIRFIEGKLNSNISNSDIEKLKNSIELIQNDSPQTIDALKELATNSMYGVSGNILFGLLTQAAAMII